MLQLYLQSLNRNGLHQYIRPVQTIETAQPKHSALLRQYLMIIEIIDEAVKMLNYLLYFVHHCNYFVEILLFERLVYIKIGVSTETLYL